MIKECPICHHIGELTWRDGKYHCDECDSEVSESVPLILPQQDTVVNNVLCPICKNGENNLFDGKKYRCALCGTPFEWPKEVQAPSYAQDTGIKNAGVTKKPRPVLRGISIFCFFGAALLLLVSLTVEPTVFIGVAMYAILGIMFLLLSKTPKGSTYLFGKQKGVKTTAFILVCLFLLFSSVIIFSVNQCEHEYVIVEARAATCTEDGEVTLVCELCDHKKTNTIKAPGHMMMIGECLRCGYIEADN